MSSTKIEEVRKPTNKAPVKPVNSIEIEVSLSAIKRGLSAIAETFRSGRSLRQDIRSLIRDPEIKSAVENFQDVDKPLVCSDTVCLERHQTSIKGVYRSEYARIVILNGDFKVEKWSESDFTYISRRANGPRHTKALSILAMAELVKEGVTADEVRRYILTI